MNAVTGSDFSKTVRSALERMAFVNTEPGEDTAGEVLAQAFGHAVVDIAAPSSRMTLVVSATPGMIREIAGGMMGLEPEEVDIDEHGRATLAELANILGGELVMKLGGETIEMRMGLPGEATDETTGAHLDHIGAGHGWACVIAGDTGRLLVAMAEW